MVALFQIATIRQEELADMVARTRRLPTHAERHQQQAIMNGRLSPNKKNDVDET